MNRLKTALSHLEARLQALVEGSLARLFPSNGLQEDLAHRLVQVMLVETQVQPGGEMVAPNLFTIYLDPSQREKNSLEPHLLDELAAQIEKAGSQAGLQFLSPPVVRILEATNELMPLQINAQVSPKDLTQTSVMIPGAAQELPAIPEGAYLIIDGARIFPLEKPVINIGRRSDNHLIIEDARISRVHAQVRAIHGKFLIFDLDSKGGTFLNNQPIQQSALSPGDVISLAGIPLVYGQDTDDLGKTQEVTFQSDEKI